VAATVDRDEGLRCDGWLVHGTTVLASACIARTRAERRRGLLGRDEVDGVMVLPVRSVHTLGMRCAIDVAFCDAAGTVLKLVTMPPGRPGRTCWAARQVIEAPEGAFASWAVRVGDVLEVRT
jgi:uncharacterized membrane protein (UPF0127 family)